MFGSERAPEEVLRTAIRLVEAGGAITDPADSALILHSAAKLVEGLNATQHPLGFLHLDLSNLAENGSARLHLWIDEFVAKADPLGRLHDHTWELRSAVLVGEIVDHVLVSTQEDQGEYLAHVVHYDVDGNRLEAVAGRWQLTEREARRVHRGRCYHLAPGLVHRTEVPMMPTATLVVPKDHGGPGPRVFTPTGLRGAEAAPRTRVEADVAAAALRAAATEAVPG